MSASLNGTGAQAAAFLRERAASDLGAVAFVAEDAWSRAFSFRQGDVDLIIRVSALREDFAKDERAARHRSAALPIPRVIEIGEAFGAFYAISERASGDFLDTLDEAALRATLSSLFDALDATRQVDISASAGYGLWHADGNAAYPSWRAALLDVGVDHPQSRTHGWRALLAGSPTGSAPFEEALRRLVGLVDFAPEERYLVHGDLLNNNVLVEDGRVSALLDWGYALYGDFLYDIAWLIFFAPWYPAWRAIDFAGEASHQYAARGLELPNHHERLRCYATHIGLEAQAYNAYQRRWNELDAMARRTLGISSQSGA